MGPGAASAGARPRAALFRAAIGPLRNICGMRGSARPSRSGCRPPPCPRGRWRRPAVARGFAGPCPSGSPPRGPLRLSGARRARRSGALPPAARRASLRAAALRLARFLGPFPLPGLALRAAAGCLASPLRPSGRGPCAPRAGGGPRGPLLASARPAAAGRCGASRLALAPPARALCGPAARAFTRRARASLGLGVVGPAGPVLFMAASGGHTAAQNLIGTKKTIRRTPSGVPPN